jgi:hypothetical protein
VVPEKLEQQVRTLLEEAKKEMVEVNSRPRAIIVPHAGYEYSGPVAASAYVHIEEHAFERVLLLGPAHRASFAGIALSSAGVFETPLGPVTVDKGAVERLTRLQDVTVDSAPHTAEHSLEVQLPFLQLTLEDFRVVPALTGQAAEDAVARLVRKSWEDVDTLVVVSSDLSHYLDYEAAKELDQATSRAIEELQPKQIKRNQACGRAAVRGLLAAASSENLEVVTLDVRSSGDTAGPRQQVVGYGAYLFHG